MTWFKLSVLTKKCFLAHSMDRKYLGMYPGVLRCSVVRVLTTQVCYITSRGKDLCDSDENS